MSVARTVLVTLATPKREVDVVADTDVPLSDLVRPVAEALGLRPVDVFVTVAPSGDADRAFTMGFGETLAQAGVVDGDRVALHPFTQPPGPAERVHWEGAAK